MYILGMFILGMLYKLYSRVCFLLCSGSLSGGTPPARGNSRIYYARVLVRLRQGEFQDRRASLVRRPSGDRTRAPVILYGRCCIQFHESPSSTQDRSSREEHRESLFCVEDGTQRTAFDSRHATTGGACIKFVGASFHTLQLCDCSFRGRGWPRNGMNVRML